MAKESYSADEFREMLKGGKMHRGRLVLPGSQDAPKRPKYNNTKVYDPETGKDVDSRKEAKHRKEYRAMAKAGEIIAYCPQAEFYIDVGEDGSGGRKIGKLSVDHLLIHLDGSMEVIDTKSPATMTPEFKRKWKVLKNKYPQITWRTRMK